MNNIDFEFPQLDKLVDWFVYMILIESESVDLSVEEAKVTAFHIQKFIESIVADTVKIVSKDNK